MQNKFYIGIITACIFMVGAGMASAAPKQAVKNIVDKTCDVVWRNLGTIAATLGIITVAANPAPFVEGAAAVVTGGVNSTHQSTVGSIFFYLLITAFTIVGVRYLWNYLKDWKNWIPLLALGVMFCSSGIAEAGVVDIPVVAKPWWDVISWILLLITIWL